MDNGRIHFWISIVKSLIRIVGGLFLIWNSWYFMFGLAFILAELLGILEEVFDDRK